MKSKRSNCRRACCLFALPVAALMVPTLAFSTGRVNNNKQKAPSISPQTVWNQKATDRRPFPVQKATVAAVGPSNEDNREELLGKVKSKLVKFATIGFVSGMCVALPITLFPIEALHRIKLISKLQRERLSLRMGTFCARWMLRLFPFVKLDVKTASYKDLEQPSVWVCNHQSMLDVFIMLAADKKMRGINTRPIKIVYWKGLEDNPITKLLFTQSGFISVDMAPNKPGEENQYERKSFKLLLKSTKQAFEDGFDIGLLPEGQLNPTPEKGLLPIFSGAFTLAKMSRRPIQLMALWGTSHVWHPNEELNEAKPTGRHVKVRVYGSRSFESSQEFMETFAAVVGHFGKTGHDSPQLQQWLDGTEWQKRKLLEEESSGSE